MRRAAKVDENQSQVVKALRDMGVTVQHLHGVGAGCPDILCGWRGMNVLLEVKDGSKPPSARQLTGPQEKWLQQWRGQAAVVTSPESAINAMHDVWRTRKALT